MPRTVRGQATAAAKEVTVWLVPVFAMWMVALVLLMILATPWWAAPDSVSIALGLGTATVFALAYARHRLHKLAELEANR